MSHIAGISSLHGLQIECFLSLDLAVDLGQAQIVLVRDHEQLADGNGQIALALLICDFLAFNLSMNSIYAHIGLTSRSEQLIDSRGKLALVLLLRILRR